ncbi:hypothetical protein GLX_06420 [Komagataeibacter medellinensis NBRC 3288]|uniref:Tetratricopeptide repeat-like domain-containing protein n=1 Tax=Komagataeibacter medellinensis (strain NBRC 3288 / BCRC 11682 / LMG 1693 / Kondo 51) TaxID=634177 RepID=G2I4K7_KOMMN|nr:hypothetical protein GLX_06420 [Komagataeibacter medellinensis NBRC 3288]
MAVCRAARGRICWGRQSRRAEYKAPCKRAGNDTNVADDIFTEVDEEIRAERIRALARRYLVVAGVVVAGICIGAGGWQYSVSRAHKADAAVSAAYFTAMADAARAPDAADSGVAPLTTRQKAGLAELQALDTKARPPLRILARMERAALLAGSGDVPAALALWEGVAQEKTVDPIIAALASLLWVQHQIDSGNPATLRSRLAVLDGAGQPWRGQAIEAEALLDLRTGNTADARARFTRLAMDMTVNDGVRNRAEAMLQTMGGDAGG